MTCREDKRAINQVELGFLPGWPFIGHDTGIVVLYK